VSIRRTLLQCLVIQLSLTASEVSSAGLLSVVFGKAPALEKTVRIGPRGARLRDEFRVRKYCSYQIDVRLVHREARLGEFDALIENDELPITVIVEMYRQESDHVERLARLEGRPRLFGRGKDLTLFNVEEVRLEKGRYRVEFSTVGEPGKLEGLDLQFVVQTRPKSVCPAKRAVP
jgi:hypothetical protein